MDQRTRRLSRLAPIDRVCPTQWQDKPVPERRWLIPGLLIRGTVTLLSGDGGVGKSLLAQQLATALATGRPFLGLPAPPKPVRSLALFCEDEFDELHFRQARINAHYGCQMSDLDAMTLLSRVGVENALMIFDRRTDEGEEAVLFTQLEFIIRTSGIELLIVDTAADTFIGNENIRSQVRQFLGALRKLAKLTDGGVLLTAHPSLSGLASGSGLSGNTAWHNTVRGRLYLTRPATPEGVEDEERTDQRALKLMKNNYGPSGETLKLVWRDHVFALDDAGRAAGGGMVERLALDNAVLGGLRRLVGDGAQIPADPHAKNSLAIRLRTLPACKRFTWQALTEAQERLVGLGRIVKVEMGPPSKRRLYLRPHDMALPGEDITGNAGA